MTVTLLKADDHARMPWKNGGGSTVEVAVYPPRSGLADFGWRISMATVAADGPFSLFPDVDRTLAILTGDGVTLDIDGMGACLMTLDSAPLAFAGDMRTTARLVGGTVTDLNVMTRRGMFSHRLMRNAFAASRVARPRWRIVMAIDPFDVMVGEKLLSLARFDVLVCGDVDAGLLLPADTTLYLIEIDDA